MNRITIIVLVLLSGATSFAQTSFQGLTPGVSTRADAERVLGQPVNKLSETLIEYRARPLTSKVFVQYRKDSPVIERVEVLCQLDSSTCADFMKSAGLSLPGNPNMRSYSGDKWKFLYGAPRFMVESGYIGAGTIESTSRLAFYSRELYEAEFARIEAVNQGEITGVVKLNGNPIAGATIDLYRTDLPGQHSVLKTDRKGVFHIVGLRGTWVVVASGPGMKWAYVPDLQIPLSSPLEIVAEAGDGTRPTQEQVLAAIK